MVKPELRLPKYFCINQWEIQFDKNLTDHIPLSFGIRHFSHMIIIGSASFGTLSKKLHIILQLSKPTFSLEFS